MTTPTKQPILSQGILTPSCDITPTRETARDEYGFASLTQNGSETPRDDDGLQVQVPARVAHHVELALTHAKLAFSS